MKMEATELPQALRDATGEQLKMLERALTKPLSPKRLRELQRLQQEAAARADTVKMASSWSDCAISTCRHA